MDRTQAAWSRSCGIKPGGSRRYKSSIAASWNFALTPLWLWSSINSIWRWWSALQTSMVKGLAKMSKPECCTLKSEKHRSNSLINRFSLIANRAHEKASGTEAEMLWQTWKWTRLSCSTWHFHRSSLRWKAVIMSDICVMTCLRPCSFWFSWARCSVMSHNIAKSHSQFGSDSSGKGFPLLCMKRATSSLSSKNRMRTLLLLSHLTSVWYGTSPCSEPTSCKSSWLYHPAPEPFHTELLDG